MAKRKKPSPPKNDPAGNYEITTAWLNFYLQPASFTLGFFNNLKPGAIVDPGHSLSISPPLHQETEHDAIYHSACCSGSIKDQEVELESEDVFPRDGAHQLMYAFQEEAGRLRLFRRELNAMPAFPKELRHYGKRDQILSPYFLMTRQVFFQTASHQSAEDLFRSAVNFYQAPLKVDKERLLYNLTVENAHEMDEGSNLIKFPAQFFARRQIVTEEFSSDTHETTKPPFITVAPSLASEAYEIYEVGPRETRYLFPVYSARQAIQVLENMEDVYLKNKIARNDQHHRLHDHYAFHYSRFKPDIDVSRISEHHSIN